MGKKALSVWAFSSLTFIATVHLIEAASVMILNQPIRLLQLYPIIGEKLQTLTPTAYLLASALSAIVFWGITCAITFENPVETFLNKILSDAKKQTAVEGQLLEDKSEVLDAMYETIASDNEILSQVKDLMCNVRADVREIPPLREGLEKVRAELSSLKKEVKRIEEKAPFANLCPACRKPLLPEFRICPYCGEPAKTAKAPVISLKDYK